MDEKIYISKDAIEIQDDMIAVCVDDELVLVDAVYCDEQGLYVPMALLSKGSNGQWWCRKCEDFHKEEHFCPRSRR